MRFFSVLFIMILSGYLMAQTPAQKINFKIKKKLLKIEANLNKIELAATKPGRKNRKAILSRVKKIRKLLKEINMLLGKKEKMLHHHKMMMGDMMGKNMMGKKLYHQSEFTKLIKSIKAETFASDKLKVLKIAAQNRWFRCEEVVKILNLFNFSSDKLKALKILNPKIYDRENAYLIIKSFTFSSDKEKAQKILSGFNPQKGL